MALDLSNTLVIGISATALFDMSESDRMFQETSLTDPDSAIEQYRAYMLKHENEPLKSGTGYPLIKALLGLNQYKQAEDKSPLVEVVVMSRNSPETGIRVLNTIRHDKLDISRSAFTAGETVADYLDAFDVDLFLTTNVADAQKVIDSCFCAAAILKDPPADSPEIPDGQVRIAFDGDAVLFSDESELVYKKKRDGSIPRSRECTARYSYGGRSVCYIAQEIGETSRASTNKSGILPNPYCFSHSKKFPIRNESD